MLLIGLHSRAHGGKDTVAQHLVRRHGFVQIAFADPIYRALALIFGVGEREVLRQHSFKEAPMGWFHGRSPRYLLQTLGTDWGRNTVHPDLWVEIAAREVERHHAANCHGVVLSDVRHDNEADYVRNKGGQIWLIVRPSQAPDRVRAHSSENGITQHGRDRGLLNDGTVADLETRVDHLIDQLQGSSTA